VSDESKSGGGIGLGGLVVVLLIGGFIYIRWTGEQEKQIESAMTSTHLSVAVAREEYESGKPPLQVIDSLIGKLSKVDVEFTPSDFRQAHLRYRMAWEALHKQLQSEPQSALAAFLTGVFNGLMGERDGGLRRMFGERAQRVEAVAQAWNELRTVAVKHGAKVP
jgi:hypothetical protein